MNESAMSRDALSRAIAATADSTPHGRMTTMAGVRPGAAGAGAEIAEDTPRLLSAAGTTVAPAAVMGVVSTAAGGVKRTITTVTAPDPIARAGTMIVPVLRATRADGIATGKAIRKPV